MKNTLSDGDTHVAGLKIENAINAELMHEGAETLRKPPDELQGDKLIASSLTKVKAFKREESFPKKARSYEHELFKRLAFLGKDSSLLNVACERGDSQRLSALVH